MSPDLFPVDTVVLWPARLGACRPNHCPAQWEAYWQGPGEGRRGPEDRCDGGEGSEPRTNNPTGLEEDTGKDAGKDASQVSSWATEQMLKPLGEKDSSRESSSQGTKTCRRIPSSVINLVIFEIPAGNTQGDIGHTQDHGRHFLALSHDLRETVLRTRITVS